MSIHSDEEYQRRWSIHRNKMSLSGFTIAIGGDTLDFTIPDVVKSTDKEATVFENIDKVEGQYVWLSKGGYLRIIYNAVHCFGSETKQADGQALQNLAWLTPLGIEVEFSIKTVLKISLTSRAVLRRDVFVVLKDIYSLNDSSLINSYSEDERRAVFLRIRDLFNDGLVTTGSTVAFNLRADCSIPSLVD